MRIKALLRVINVLGAVCSMAMLPSAHAVQHLTFVVPDCPTGQSLAFNANQLSCVSGVGVVQPPGGTAPPSNCSITQQLNTNDIVLTASCNSGGLVATWQWNNGQTGQQITVPASSASYTVTASNAGGQSTATTTIVPTVASTGQNFCSGSDQQINVGWPTNGQVRPSTNGFGNQRIAFRITVPSSTAGLDPSNTGFFHIFEVPGKRLVPKDVTVSKNACDFTSGTYLYSSIGYNQTSPSLNFTVGNPVNYSYAGANFNVQPGDVIYVNVRNVANGVPSCPTYSCDIYLDFAAP